MTSPKIQPPVPPSPRTVSASAPAGKPVATPTMAPSKGWLPSSSNRHLGSINVASLPTTSDTYKKGSDGQPNSVAIHVLPPNGSKAPAVAFTTAMMIDADGAGDAWKKDPSGQNQTALTDQKGRSLDPTKIPYLVLPGGFEKSHPGIKLGDVAAVFYKGRVSYAIYGDVGPSQQIGEGSIALAKSLGIPSSATQGGVADGVTYLVFPGSGTGQPLSAAEIQTRASALLTAAGGQPN